jgi:mono/diheme cytochrome c family protein
MNRSRLAVLPFCFLALITACQTDKPLNAPPANNNATAAPSSTPDQFAATRVAYDANCRLCHGAKGEGGPIKLEDGTKLKVPNLREGHALRDPDADFVKQINKGGDGMPAFGEKLKPEEINELVRFIRREFQAGQASPAK